MHGPAPDEVAGPQKILPFSGLFVFLEPEEIPGCIWLGPQQVLTQVIERLHIGFLAAVRFRRHGGVLQQEDWESQELEEWEVGYVK